VIVIGLLALILNALLLDFVFFLVMLLFPGNPRNNTLFLALLLKQNIDLWLLVLVILLSYFLSFMIYTFLILNQLYYSVTVKLPFISQLILFFTRGLSILISIVTSFVIKYKGVYFVLCILPLSIRLQISLLRLLAEFLLNICFPR
jgi:hypothetical protein